MGVKRRIRITIKSETAVLMLARSRLIRGWCPVCAAAAEFTNLPAVNDQGSRRLVRLIDEGKAHSIEASDGLSLICLRSLAERFNRDEEPEC